MLHLEAKGIANQASQSQLKTQKLKPEKYNNNNDYGK